MRRPAEKLFCLPRCEYPQQGCRRAEQRQAGAAVDARQPWCAGGLHRLPGADPRVWRARAADGGSRLCAPYAPAQARMAGGRAAFGPGAVRHCRGGAGPRRGCGGVGRDRHAGVIQPGPRSVLGVGQRCARQDRIQEPARPLDGLERRHRRRLYPGARIGAQRGAARSLRSERVCHDVRRRGPAVVDRAAVVQRDP